MQDVGRVAELPSLPGACTLMPAREEALAELREVFDLIAQEYAERGEALPADTTEVVSV